MAPKNSNSSALRNNRAASRSNDVADNDLIASIFASAGQFEECQHLLDQIMGSQFVAREVRKGFSLAFASPATWLGFLKNPFWKARPKQKPQENEQASAVRFVLRIFFGNAKNGNKRANEIWVAVQQLVREDFTPAQILAKFSTGLGAKGMDLKAVCRRAADHNRVCDSAMAKAATKLQGKSNLVTKVRKTASISEGKHPDRIKAIPTKKRSPALGGAVSMKLQLFAVPPEFLRLQQGEEVNLTVKIRDFGAGNFTAEFIKMHSTKSE